jgi:hypothetical protein
MRRLTPPVLPDELRADSFTGLVKEVEPRIRRALSVAFGIELGADATAEALAHAWEHWERVEEMENPAG